MTTEPQDTKDECTCIGVTFVCGLALPMVIDRKCPQHGWPQPGKLDRVTISPRSQSDEQ